METPGSGDLREGAKTTIGIALELLAASPTGLPVADANEARIG